MQILCLPLAIALFSFASLNIFAILLELRTLSVFTIYGITALKAKMIPITN